MRILLINPRAINRDALPLPPLGILYLAAYIRQRGYGDIKIIDNDLEDSPVSSLRQELLSADIVGLTGTTNQFKRAMEIAIEAKRLDKNKFIVFGGPHATFLPEEVLSLSGADAVVIGEGEETFYELVKTIDSRECLSFVDGIVYRKENIVVTNNARPPIRNLNDLPMPARDLVPIPRYPNRDLKRFSGPYTSIMSSRGCNGKCFFCSSPFMWGYPRFRNAENTFKEMMEIYQNYGIKNIHFHDDAFTLSKKRVIEFCRLIIESGIDFKWSCLARPDYADLDMLKEMKRAGCIQVEFGVESGDEMLMKNINKGYSRNDVRVAFDNAHKAGLPTRGFFIVGSPGETIWTWIKTIAFARSLKMDSSAWTVLTPFPGTRLFHEKMVDILDVNYIEWRYKYPVIKSGHFGPRTLMIMRAIADRICNGFFDISTYRI